MPAIVIPNTFTPSTTISSSQMNANFSEVADGIVNSLARDGSDGMLQPLRLANGTAALPSATFASDPDTGFYRRGANQLGAATAGVERFYVDEDGKFFLLGALEVSGSVVSQAAPAGALTDFLGVTAPAGWVLAAGKTIGSAASGGTERANADTVTLFALLWNSYSNTILPIQNSAGGADSRGASAAADFAANKRMPVPDLRGRVAVGDDNMGGTAANRVTTAGSGIDGVTLGASGGAQNVALSIAELAAHDHGGGTNTTGLHGHPTNMSTQTNGDGDATGGLMVNSNNQVQQAAFTGSPTSTNGQQIGGAGDHSHTISSQGSGTAHNNMPPSWIVNKIIKL